MIPSLPGAASAWEEFRPATCLPDECFCEAVRSGLIRQPANTWSSLAFVLVASWVAVRYFRSARNRPLSGSETGLFASSLVVVGLGSAFYHASLTFVGQVIDVAGMYLLATFILLHRLGPIWSVKAVPGVLGFATANGVLMVLQVTTPSLRRVVFALLLVTALVVEWRASRAGRKWLATGAGLMAIAFAIWVADRMRFACDADSLFQGHAVWHGLGALAAACLFKSYERDVT